MNQESREKVIEKMLIHCGWDVDSVLMAADVFETSKTTRIESLDLD